MSTMKKKEEEEERNPSYRYNFNSLFTLESNISYFEGMLHSFKISSEEKNLASAAEYSFEFILDKQLRIEDTGNKERINLMLFYNRNDGSVEFCYPWFKPICAKLEFLDQGFRFTFNKYYLSFSNIVAEGWELIDIFRSTLLSLLIRTKRYMFHAAAVRLGNEGILMPAWGNTGKTSTSWMLAKNGAEFLTDEFAIIDSDFSCYGLPCSSLVSAATATKFGAKLTQKERVKLFFSDAKSKILSSRFAPGGIKIYPDRLFKFRGKSEITKLAIIQRGPDSFSSVGKHEAFLKIKSIQDYEFAWKSNPFLLAKSFFSGFDLNALAAVENNFLETFLGKLETYVVSSNSGEQYKALLSQRPKAETDEGQRILQS